MATTLSRYGTDREHPSTALRRRGGSLDVADGLSRKADPLAASDLQVSRPHQRRTELRFRSLRAEDRQIREGRARFELLADRIQRSGAGTAATLERFASQFHACGFDSSSFYPCYGLAEATLVVTAPTGRRVPPVRNIDRSALEENRASNGETGKISIGGRLRSSLAGPPLAIVDPILSRARASSEGSAKSGWPGPRASRRAYWRQPAETERTFHAVLEGRSTRRFMRTGDLEFLEEPNVDITGRLKDLIVIADEITPPQDFETAIEENVEEIRPGCCAAFSTPSGEEEEEALVLIVEPQRGQLAVLRDDGLAAAVSQNS